LRTGSNTLGFALSRIGGFDLNILALVISDCCELDKSEALNLICHASPLLAAYILSFRSCNLVLKILIQPSHEPLILLHYHKPASCNRLWARLCNAIRVRCLLRQKEYSLKSLQLLYKSTTKSPCKHLTMFYNHVLLQTTSLPRTSLYNIKYGLATRYFSTISQFANSILATRPCYTHSPSPCNLIYRHKSCNKSPKHFSFTKSPQPDIPLQKLQQIPEAL
jgi:hypothetical protein